MNYSRVGANPVYLAVHIDTEYHFRKKVGAFLDLSTGYKHPVFLFTNKQ